MGGYMRRQRIPASGESGRLVKFEEKAGSRAGSKRRRKGRKTIDGFAIEDKGGLKRMKFIL